MSAVQRPGPRATRPGRWWDRFRRRGWVAHLWRTIDRYQSRLGGQFAGALTFNSVLAVVPVLMFGFSLLGVTLTVLRPDWLTQVKALVTATLDSVTGAERIATVIDGFLAGWRGVGVLGLLVAMVAGLGWIGSLRAALHSLCRPGFEVEVVPRNFFLQRLIDLVLLAGFMVLTALTVSSAAIGSWLGPRLLHLVHLDAVPGYSWLVRGLGLAITVGTGFGLFVFIYRVLTDIGLQRRAIARGSLAAAVAVAALQYLAPVLVGVLGQNRGVQVFGTLLVVMVLLNVFAQIVLLVATWIATANQPAMARRWIDADEPLMDLPDTVTVPGHWVSARQYREAKLARAGEERGEPRYQEVELEPAGPRERAPAARPGPVGSGRRHWSAALGGTLVAGLGLAAGLALGRLSARAAVRGPAPVARWRRSSR